MLKTYTGLKRYGFSLHGYRCTISQLQPLTFLYDLIFLLIKIQPLFGLERGKQEEMFFWDDLCGKI